MPCYHPIEVPKKGYVDLFQTVACGRCLGCRLEKRRQWAVRLLDESKRHLFSAFLTLTYDDEYLPKNKSLQKRDAVLWQKRLRFAREGEKLRFFTVGEYGERTKRPHYHSIVYGLFVADKRPHSKSGEHQLYASDEMNKVWGLGHVWVGSVTMQSCEYVAAYVVKKVNGQMADAHYEGREPEFAIMSRRPGIGAEWYAEHKGDVFPSDVKVVKGRQMAVPKFYSDRFKKENPEEFDKIKARRLARAKLRRKDSTPERLAAREEVAAARLQLKRSKI